MMMVDSILDSINNLDMEREYIAFVIEIFISGHGKKTNLMGKEFMKILMEINTKASS